MTALTITDTGAAVETSRRREVLGQFLTARDRLDELEQLGRWGIDLRARVWRAWRTFELADVNVDVDALAVEVAQYRQVCRFLRWRRT
jgi:hypothetical protein